MLGWNCAPVGTRRFMILYLVKTCLSLLNVGILNYGQSYYLIALSII